MILPILTRSALESNFFSLITASVASDVLMFVCRMRAPLLLAVLSLCGAAVPDPPRGVIGARKYATNLHDCNGAVAFSSAGAIAPTKQDNGKLAYRKALIDKGIGWSPESGDFTCFCPGLYQFAFAGNGKTAATRLAMIYYRVLLLLLLLLCLVSQAFSSWYFS